MTGLQPSQNPITNGVPLEAPSSMGQGFGRVHLGQTLPLAGSPGLKMQVRRLVAVCHLLVACLLVALTQA